MKNLNENHQKQIKDNNINNKKTASKNIDILSDIQELFNHFSNNSKYLSNKDFKLFLTMSIEY